MHIDIERAADLKGALAALSREGGGLRPVAGGTDVLLRLEAGKLKAQKLLCIADLEELASVRLTPTHVEIGALALVADLPRHPEIRRELSCLAKAASEFASPQIRNRATVGGNIGNASPAADLVPPLIALGAQVTLASQRGERALPLEELFVGPGRTALAPDELIAFVKVPRRAGAFQFFAKFGNRGANVIAIVNVALCLELEGKTVRAARAAYGCCGPTPLRARKLEAFLAGKTVNEKLVAGVAEVLAGELKPIDDIRGSRRFKQLLAVHATEDALEEIRTGTRQAA
jgi:CO/xanthine dehydrogenase FAD-binding subunit